MGKCLFRCISKEVTLSEEHYAEVRKATVEPICGPEYGVLFKDTLGKPPLTTKKEARWTKRNNKESR